MGKERLPHEIDAQVDAQFDEELVHLAEIGGVAVGVEQRGGGHGVADVDGHDLRAPPRRELQDLHVLAVGERAQQQQPGPLVGHQLVRRRARREERELRRH